MRILQNGKTVLADLCKYFGAMDLDRLDGST